MLTNLKKLVYKLKLKVGAVALVLIFVLSSCWAPRCPMNTCRSKYEHTHSHLVSGVFSPRYGVPHKAHFPWDRDKGEANPDTDFVPGSSRSKKKTKKKYPWERW